MYVIDDDKDALLVGIFCLSLVPLLSWDQANLIDSLVRFQPVGAMVSLFLAFCRLFMLGKIETMIRIQQVN